MPGESDNQRSESFGKATVQGAEPPKEKNFAAHLKFHLQNGTRPGGRPGQLGLEWADKDFASEIQNKRGSRIVGKGDAAKNLRNWLRGGRCQNQDWANAIERTLFGDNAEYYDWRVQLRAARKARPQESVEVERHAERNAPKDRAPGLVRKLHDHLAPEIRSAIYDDADVAAFRQKWAIGHDEVASFGSNIEIVNWLNPGKPAINQGILPEQLFVNADTRPPNFEKELVDQGVKRHLVDTKSRNGKKLALVGIDPPNLHDSRSERVTLKTSYTDYYTIMSCLDRVKQDRELRHHFMKVEPESHRIPHSLCLHLVVCFADQKLLFLRRADYLAYSPGLVSFSVEEQFDPESEDLHPPGSCSNWVLRALLEEVFPHRGCSVYSREAAEVGHDPSLQNALCIFRGVVRKLLCNGFHSAQDKCR